MQGRGYTEESVRWVESFEASRSVFNSESNLVTSSSFAGRVLATRLHAYGSTLTVVTNLFLFFAPAWLQGGVDGRERQRRRSKFEVQCPTLVLDGAVPRSAYAILRGSIHEACQINRV